MFNSFITPKSLDISKRHNKYKRWQNIPWSFFSFSFLFHFLRTTDQSFLSSLPFTLRVKEKVRDRWNPRNWGYWWFTYNSLCKKEGLQVGTQRLIKDPGQWTYSSYVVIELSQFCFEKRNEGLDKERNVEDNDTPDSDRSVNKLELTLDP